MSGFEIDEPQPPKREPADADSVWGRPPQDEPAAPTPATPTPAAPQPPPGRSSASGAAAERARTGGAGSRSCCRAARRASCRGA